MGLDSVELLISFENYFNIQVPDQEAEKIGTIQEMVDCVAKHLSVSSSGEQLQQAHFEHVKANLIQLGWASKDLKAADYIAPILEQNNQDAFRKLSELLGIIVPQPTLSSDTLFTKVFRRIIWRPQIDWEKLSIQQFITAIYANNYETVISKNAIKTKYEILIAVIAITVDRLGLDIYEVQPEKSFVNDFGID